MVWFKIDSFSSFVVTGSVIKNHVMDSKGIGSPASMFLSGADFKVKFSADKCSVCQVLSFRGKVLSISTLSFIVGVVNLYLLCLLGVIIASMKELENGLKCTPYYALNQGLM